MEAPKSAVLIDQKMYIYVWGNAMSGRQKVFKICTHVLVDVRTVFGRPFVKKFALWYQTVVCPICPVCPVCDVGVLWPNGWTDQDETWHAGRPRPWPHCVRWGPSSPNLRPISVAAKWLDGSRCHLVWRLASAQATLC